MKIWKKTGAILMGLMISVGAVITAYGGEDGSVIDTAADKPVLLHPVVLAVSRSESAASGEEEYDSASAYIHYPQIGLTGEEVQDYPNLRKALDAYNAGKKSWYESQLTELTKTAEEMAKYREEEGVDDASSWIYLTQVADTQIGRADSRIFSVIEHFSSYSGGAHGYYQDMGNTFDTQSGKKLAFPAFGLRGGETCKREQRIFLCSRRVSKKGPLQNEIFAAVPSFIMARSAGLCF